MSSGELAVIDVFVIMGGVNIFVPPNWTVSQEVVPLLGGVHDKTRSVPSSPAQHLLVRARWSWAASKSVIEMHPILADAKQLGLYLLGCLPSGSC